MKGIGKPEQNGVQPERSPDEDARWPGAFSAQSASRSDGGPLSFDGSRAPSVPPEEDPLAQILAQNHPSPSSLRENAGVAASEFAALAEPQPAERSQQISAARSAARSPFPGTLSAERLEIARAEREAQAARVFAESFEKGLQTENEERWHGEATEDPLHPYGEEEALTEQTFDLNAQLSPEGNARGEARYGKAASQQMAYSPTLTAEQRALLAQEEQMPFAERPFRDAAAPQRTSARQAGNGAAPRAGKPAPAHAAAPQHGRRGPAPETPRAPRKKKHRVRRALLVSLGALLLTVGTALTVYLKIATQNDFLWLDLAQLPHRDATILYAQDAQGNWNEYARLEATQQKQWVSLADIPQDLQHAFVAIEDKNFYEHHGVSWTRTIYAILNEIKHSVTGTYFGGENGIKQGASTIDQQLIKNLTYDDDVGGMEGYLRKIREIYRAYHIDKEYDKDTILEAYLNVISFTGNTAGVQAESLKLFGVPVGQLTLEQCASIAAITKNPYRYDPTRNPDTHLTRRNYILYEMWQQGYLTEEQYNAASAQPIGLNPGVVEVPETPVTSYFTDQVIEDVKADLSAAYHLDAGEITRLLYDGGLRIYTTVDSNLQSVMEAAMLSGSQFFPQPGIASTRPVYNEDGTVQQDENGNPVYEDYTQTPQAAMVSVDYSGALKAVVGGIGEKQVSRGFNRGTHAERQVGSTMKPIGAYVLALENNQVNWSTPLLDSYVKKIKDDATGELREWPVNFSRTYSNEDVLVVDALAQSINTIAVRVGQRAGTWNIYNFTRNKLHISGFTLQDCAAGPMVLGSSTYGVTPYELAGAYMMFGNGGSYTTLHSYTSVQTGYGREICTPKLETEQVISSDTAYIMNRLLRQVMEGYGTAYGYSVSGSMDSVGKTGTSSDNRDFWFVGLTPYYVTATWYGYDSGDALNTSAGTHAPTSAWKYVMERAQSALAIKEFPVDGTVVEAQFCTESGGLATSSCPSVRTGYYRAGQLPESCKLHPAA